MSHANQVFSNDAKTYDQQYETIQISFGLNMPLATMRLHLVGNVVHWSIPTFPSLTGTNLTFGGVPSVGSPTDVIPLKYRPLIDTPSSGGVTIAGAIWGTMIIIFRSDGKIECVPSTNIPAPSHFPPNARPHIGAGVYNVHVII